eukprot:GHVU01004302.1.p3 GENE.GHVU01004302.1~~GHVU01004302.1.p3  ORF type:complete len:125 (-),score=16.88 GHVU01004302.1:59-433(-)
MQSAQGEHVSLSSPYDCVCACFRIATLDGAIIACGRKPEDAEKHEGLQTAVAALTAVFSEYAHEVSSALVDTAGCKAWVGALGQGALLLCVLGTTNAEAGLLKSKFDALMTNVSPALGDLCPNM